MLGYLSRATPKKEVGKVGRLVLHQCGQELVPFSRPIGSSSRPPRPFHELISDFVEFMRSAQGLSSDTIRGYSSRAGIFLAWMATRHNSLSSVSLNDVDEFLASKARDGWGPGTLAAQGQALRAFFGHAGIRGWCAPGIARGIRSPAVPKYDGLGRGPTWKDVRQLLQSTRGSKPATLRARAILSLCSMLPNTEE